jgi:hypothetical protein
MKTLVSYSRAPLVTVIPSFIGIQYSNDENIIIYSFFRIPGELIFLENNQYIVVVKASSINFIEGNIDDTYDYFDEALYQRPLSNDWWRERLGENIVELKIENNSGSYIQIYIETVYEEKIIAVEKGMTVIYSIGNKLISLGGMRIVTDNESILLENFWNRGRNSNASIYSNRPINIKLKLNRNGYEISYY